MDNSVAKLNKHASFANIFRSVRSLTQLLYSYCTCKMELWPEKMQFKHCKQFAVSLKESILFLLPVSVMVAP